MTPEQIADLRRLAEAATDGAEGIFNRRTWEFRQAANPATVLELLGDLSNWQNNSHCMGEEINEWKARAEAAEARERELVLQVAYHATRAEKAEAKLARLKECRGCPEGTPHDDYPGQTCLDNQDGYLCRGCQNAAELEDSPCP